MKRINIIIASITIVFFSISSIYIVKAICLQKHQKELLMAIISMESPYISGEDYTYEFFLKNIEIFKKYNSEEIKFLNDLSKIKILNEPDQYLMDKANRIKTLFDSKDYEIAYNNIRTYNKDALLIKHNKSINFESKINIWIGLSTLFAIMGAIFPTILILLEKKNT